MLKVHVAGFILVCISLLGIAVAPPNWYAYSILRSSTWIGTEAVGAYHRAYRRALAAEGLMPVSATGVYTGAMQDRGAVMHGARFARRLSWQFHVNRILLFRFLLPLRTGLLFPSLAILMLLCIAAAVHERIRLSQLIHFRVIPQESMDGKRDEPKGYWAVLVIWLGVAVFLAPIPVSAVFPAALVTFGLVSQIVHIPVPLLNANLNTP